MKIMKKLRKYVYTKGGKELQYMDDVHLRGSY